MQHVAPLLVLSVAFVLGCSSSSSDLSDKRDKPPRAESLDSQINAWEGTFKREFFGISTDDGSWTRATQHLAVNRSALYYEDVSTAGAAETSLATLTMGVRCRNANEELLASTNGFEVRTRCYLSLTSSPAKSLWSDSVALDGTKGFSTFYFNKSDRSWRTYDGQGKELTLRPSQD